MAGNNNKKVFFRQPGLNPEVDQQAFLPVDIAKWLNQFQNDPGRVAEALASILGDNWAADGGDPNQFPAGFASKVSEHEILPYDKTKGPGLTAKQPQILDIVSQKVVQDPQGNATITVVLSIGPEQDNMRYEIRLSKA